MYHFNIEEIRANFHVDETVLQKRSKVATYIQSFASLIVEQLIERLAQDENIRRYLVNVEMNRFKKAISDYVAELYCSPFDQQLINRIEYIGNLHYSINLYPEHLSLGYDVLREVILDLSLVNEQVRNDLNVILKFMHISEFIMQNSFYTHTMQEERTAALRKESFPLTEKLHQADTIHKHTMSYLRTLYESPDPLAQLASIEEHLSPSSQDCKATALYTEINAAHEPTDLPFDISHLQDEHEAYHQAIGRFLDQIGSEAPKAELESSFKELETRYDAFVTPLESALEEQSETMLLMINSAMQFIKTSSRKFRAVTIFNSDGTLKHEQLGAMIGELFTYNFDWCVTGFDLYEKRADAQACNFVYELNLKYSTLYVGLTLRKITESDLLQNLITLLLENMKNILMVIEREKSLELLADKAEEANRAKDMFLANMSHELRTPLNAIIGFSQILAVKKDIPQQYNSYLDKIGIAGKNLLNLVNTILDFAKLEAGKFQYKPENVNSYITIKEVVAVIDPLAKAKSITFEYPQFTSHTLLMDPMLIKQVLTNLLSNAVKFTDEGGRVSLDARFTPEGDAFEFTVSDTGVGIDAENLTNLFQPFKQIDNPFQKSSQGTGLGLVISKKIVEDLHGGKMWVESTPGEGSRFHFTLPIKATEIFIKRLPATTPGSQRMLIVEDSNEYLNILLEHLSGRYEITMTNSVNKAKDLLEHEKFDIGIYDFFLIDGISTELISFMDHHDIQFPILVISAESDHDLMVSFQASSNVEGIFRKEYIDEVLGALTKKGKA
jgi:signal transduction histidine kinase